MDTPLLVSSSLEIEYKILPFQNQGIEYKILPSLSVGFAFTLKEDREIEYKILPFPHQPFLRIYQSRIHPRKFIPNPKQG